MQATTITDQVKDVFEQVTLMDLTSVDLNVSLEDDLGIDMDSDYPRIVTRLIKLIKRYRPQADTEELSDLFEDAQILNDVVAIVKEETELG